MKEIKTVKEFDDMLAFLKEEKEKGENVNATSLTMLETMIAIEPLIKRQELLNSTGDLLKGCVTGISIGLGMIVVGQTIKEKNLIIKTVKDGLSDDEIKKGAKRYAKDSRFLGNEFYFTNGAEFYKKAINRKVNKIVKKK